MAIEPSTTMNLACPVPTSDYKTVLLAHGGGGKLMHDLITKLIVPAFDNASLRTEHDAAVLKVGSQKIAFTTDSYVVRPLFFPGGDLGSLAVHGTVNDLAMAGARALYLSAAFIIEEGLPMETLRSIIGSMQSAALKCGVQIVTGDTKVVDKGKGDSLFINTAGIGIVEHAQTISPSAVRGGDAVLVSGDLGRHGMAIMAVREGLEFESAIESDSAPVGDIVAGLLAAGVEIHCLRDITRGGLTSVLNEISGSCGFHIELEESNIPVRSDVAAACEILGFDPLQVACEGRFAAFVPEGQVGKALEIMRHFEHGAGACRVGTVSHATGRRVILKNRLGSRRVLEMSSGEQLPRIC